MAALTHTQIQSGLEARDCGHWKSKQSRPMHTDLLGLSPPVWPEQTLGADAQTTRLKN